MLNMLSREGRQWRFQGIDANAWFVALILALTSSADPRREPSSFTDFHVECCFVTVLDVVSSGYTVSDCLRRREVRI